MYGTSEQQHLGEIAWILTIREGDLIRVAGHAQTRAEALSWYDQHENAGFMTAWTHAYPVGMTWIEKDELHRRLSDMGIEKAYPWE